jgi:hypothetical protein
MTYPARSSLVPAQIVHGSIIDVDVKTYTVMVATEFAKKPQAGISFASPYHHPENGEGIYAMPEVGSLCWVCFPSDGSKAFVLAWSPASAEGDYRSRRMDLNPGDIYLGTRDENCLILRRGGIVQIGSTGICQRLFLPVDNIIHDMCQNYRLDTFGGTLEWTVDPANSAPSDNKGKRPTRLVLTARESASDAGSVARLEIGSHPSDRKAILSLAIRGSGEEKSDVVVSLKIERDGTVRWDIKKDVIWNVAGKYSVTADSVSVESTTGDLALKASKGKATVVGSSGVSISGSKGPVDVSAKEITLDGAVTAGAKDGGTYVVLASSDFLAFLNHTHPVAAVGSPSGPPTPLPSASSIVAKKLKAV